MELIRTVSELEREDGHYSALVTYFMQRTNKNNHRVSVHPNPVRTMKQTGAIIRWADICTHSDSLFSCSVAGSERGCQRQRDIL
jgi:hypothetical protein